MQWKGWTPLMWSSLTFPAHDLLLPCGARLTFESWSLPLATSRGPLSNKQVVGLRGCEAPWSYTWQVFLRSGFRSLGIILHRCFLPRCSNIKRANEVAEGHYWNVHFHWICLYLPVLTESESWLKVSWFGCCWFCFHISSISEQNTWTAAGILYYETQTKWDCCESFLLLKSMFAFSTGKEISLLALKHTWKKP